MSFIRNDPILIAVLVETPKYATYSVASTKSHNVIQFDGESVRLQSESVVNQNNK